MTKMLFVSRCSVKILVSDENMEKKENMDRDETQEKTYRPV